MQNGGNTGNFSIKNSSNNCKSPRIKNGKMARLSESESSSSWENKHDINIKTKNSENRLKLTIRVKRSPDFPEYEILRTEGINYTSESTSEASLQNVSSKHHKRRHRHKKSKSKRNYDEKLQHPEKPSTKRVKLLFGDNEMKILNIPSLEISKSVKEIPSFY